MQKQANYLAYLAAPCYSAAPDRSKEARSQVSAYVRTPYLPPAQAAFTAPAPSSAPATSPAPATYVRTASSAVREQRIAWKQKDGKELCEVYLKLRRFGQRYPADPAIKSSLQALERRVEEVRKELHGSSGWGKKIVLTLGLTFLSACTVRYWIDKLEPLIEDYAIQQQANAQPDIPSQYSLQRPLPFEEKSDRGEARSGRGAPAAGEASGIEGVLGGAQ